MLPREFSDQFDILYNNVTSNQAPGLNEYEKSVFLTLGEKQLVNEYFNSRVDTAGGGYDGSKRRQYDFSSITRTETLFNVNTFKERITSTEKIDTRSKVFLFPQDYFLSVNEIISDDKYQYSVLPISYAEYQRLMLKPYSYPIKKAAWRLISDKKNCNYCREYIKTVNIQGNEIDSTVDYVILSSWADNKRNIELSIYWVPCIETEDFITFNFTQDNSLDGSRVDIDPYPKVPTEQDDPNLKMPIGCATKWSSDKQTYRIHIFIGRIEDNDTIEDDEQVIEAIRSHFHWIMDNYGNADRDMRKAAQHLDCLNLCSAPSKYKNFKATIDVDDNDSVTPEGGKTFITSCIQLPIAEVIGKFTGPIQYRLKYIRTLKPIILEDLTNYSDTLSIDGITQMTECELPSEMHQEILERAVTLAKIAWQGLSSTQVAAQQNDSK